MSSWAAPPGQKSGKSIGSGAWPETTKALGVVPEVRAMAGIVVGIVGAAERIVEVVVREAVVVEAEVGPEATAMSERSVNGSESKPCC
jgi:hypothetical protein